MTATTNSHGTYLSRESVVRVSFRDTAVGEILVASSPAGVCAALLGDDHEALLSDIRARFPRANVVVDDVTPDAAADAIASLVETPARCTDLVLDVNGTDFQREVWSVLKTIPPGTTASYAEIAERVGRPRAVRAVARACAANPVALVIPCHRVLRSDGGLSGYRWGIERKRALLTREGAIAR